MLLKKINLKNIRSYNQAEINFSPGSTLLSGDIGSGKSTILLAIEFALFGASRADLPAEALLRKGETHGSVQLMFSIENKEIIVERALKKDAHSIKQTSGYLIINGIKKEATPVELKSLILELLQYPEGTQRNHIFRYTVYTPQDAMKFILQEKAETRLSVLRKVFNIDKYQNILENLQYTLKVFRSRLGKMEGQVEPLPEKKNKLAEVIQQKQKSAQEVDTLKPVQDELKNKINNLTTEIKSIKVEQEKTNQLNTKLTTTQKIIEEKQANLEDLQNKEKKINENLNELVNLPKKDSIETEINKLELEQQNNLSNKIKMEQQISSMQSNIQRLNIEVKTFQTALSKKEEKETLLLTLKNEIILGVNKEKELIQTENEINNLTLKNSSLNLLQQQAHKICSNMKDLRDCPTCLQQVPTEYRSKILNDNQSKSEQLQQQLTNNTTLKQNLIKKKEELAKQITILSQKKELKIKLESELTQLEEKSTKMKQMKEELKQALKSNNELMASLPKNQNEIENKIKTDITNLRITLQNINLKLSLEQHKGGLVVEQQVIHQEIIFLAQQTKTTQNQLLGRTDLTEVIKQKNVIRENLLEEEKKVLQRLSTSQTILENYQQRELELQIEIDKLKQIENKKIRLQDLFNWIENFLLPLNKNIEKHIMVHIHQTFNQLFQEWFSLLIANDEMYVRLDDSFSPTIEQNGYEILFQNLSGGEKTSVSLAYRLALNKVINDIMHNIQTKELLILDEPTDGFSSEQLDKVRDVLERLNLKQTLIVSHEHKIESFVENVIRIDKQGDESTIFS